MDIIVTAFNRRNLDNIAPALELCQRRGLSLAALLFPNLNDPSSCELDSLPFQVVGRHEIHLESVVGGLYRVGMQREYCDLPNFLLSSMVHDIVQRLEPKLFILTGGHRYPENAIFDALSELPHRPVVLGIQHGVYQRWSWYNERFAFDYFGLFGASFSRHFAKRHQERLRLVGLPKLDALQDVKPSEHNRNIVFCAQDTLDSATVKRMLAALEREFGLPAVIRLHPEHRSHLSELRSSFRFSDSSIPLTQQLESTGFLITTGSTVGLEGLVAGVPTVVIDDGAGAAEYEELGIVTPPEPERVAAVLRSQLDPENSSVLREKLNRFLVSCGTSYSEVFYSVVAGLIGKPIFQGIS